MDFNFPEQLDNNKISTHLLTFIDYTLFINQYLNSKINRNCIMNFKLLSSIKMNEMFFLGTEEIKTL